VIGRSGLVLLVVASVVLVGCSTERERQWYKPGVNYTIAEFTRDRDECTKNRELDEQCMKQKGWVPLTADRDGSKGPAAPNPRGPRY
jgi:hypothetical protein